MTRNFVRLEILAPLVKHRETADWDTPASVATFWDVGFFNLVFIYAFIHRNNIQYIA
jgi:hypothetical protein